MIDEIFEKCIEVNEQEEDRFPDDLVAVAEIENLEQAIEWIKKGGWDEVSDFVQSVGEDPEELIGMWVMTEDAVGPQGELEELDEPITIYTIVHNRPYSEEVMAYTDRENIFVSEAHFM